MNKLVTVRAIRSRCSARHNKYLTFRTDRLSKGIIPKLVIWLLDVLQKYVFSLFVKFLQVNFCRFNPDDGKLMLMAGWMLCSCCHLSIFREVFRYPDHPRATVIDTKFIPAAQVGER